MPNLPNLSSSRAFLSQSPNSFYSGSDYRDKIRENIQNTPRKDNFLNNRSIDLSLTRENSTFRPVSRIKPQNKAQSVNPDLETELNTTKGRRRELVFYNKNEKNNQSSNDENQENFDVWSSESNKKDNDNNENSYTSRRKRFEDNNFKQNSFSENGIPYTERIHTARESTQTPRVKPRKIHNEDLENEGNLRKNVKTPLKTRNHDGNENEIFPGISSNPQEELNRSHRHLKALNSENNRPYPSPDNDLNLRSSSRTNLNDNITMPVPTPRKRDVSSKILNIDTADFRIKRISSVNSSGLTTPRSTYQPSTPRINPHINNRLDTKSNINHLSEFENKMNDSLQRYPNSQDERSTRILSNNLQTEKKPEDVFFTKERREPTARRRERTNINIDLDPKLETKTFNKNKFTYD